MKFGRLYLIYMVEWKIFINCSSIILGSCLQFLYFDFFYDQPKSKCSAFLFVITFNIPTLKHL